MGVANIALGKVVKSTINGASFAKGELFRVVSLIGERPGSCDFIRCEPIAAPFCQPFYFRPQEVEPVGEE